MKHVIEFRDWLHGRDSSVPIIMAVYAAAILAAIAAVVTLIFAPWVMLGAVMLGLATPLVCTARNYVKFLREQ